MNMATSVTLDDLNDKQKATLNKFREAVNDVLRPEDDDHFLVRWLVARNFDIKKAEQMLRKHMEFSKEWRLDTLLTDYKAPEVLKIYYPGGICGHDNEGCPIWITPCAGYDWKGLTLSLKKRVILHYVCYIMESIMYDFKQQTEKLGHRVDKFVFVVDMEGYGFSHLFAPGADTMLELFGMVETNYPEVVKACYIINGTVALPLLYNLAKPFLHDATKKKMFILGKSWKDRFLATIPADQLPVKWGGTMTENGDPACPSIVTPGGTVDASYYVSGESLIQENQTVIHKSISRAASLQLEFPVKAGDVLKWVFWTKKYDIKFGVTHHNVNGEKTESVCGRRLSCNMVPEDGFCLCEAEGKYVVKFDNSYSWTHSKSLNYVIEVVSPEPIIQEDEVNQQLSEITLL